MRLIVFWTTVFLLATGGISAAAASGEEDPPAVEERREGLRMEPGLPVWRAESYHDFEQIVRALYKRIETYSQALTPLEIEVGDIVTRPLDEVLNVPLREFGDLPEGWRLQMLRDTDRDFDGNETTTYIYKWQLQEPMHLGNPIRLWDWPLGEVLAVTVDELPEHQLAEFVSTYTVWAEGLGHSRYYRASIFWARTQEEGRWYPATHDHILDGLSRAAAETNKVRTPEEQRRIDGPNWKDSASVVPPGAFEQTSACKVEKKLTPSWDHDFGIEEHAEGRHSSEFGGKFECECESGCTQYCQFQYDGLQQTCAETGYLIGPTLATHHSTAWDREKVRGSSGAGDRNPAQCEAGFGCVVKRCIGGCAKFSVTVSVIGGELTISPQDHDYDLSLSLAHICANCEKDCLVFSPNGTDSVDICGGDDPRTGGSDGAGDDEFPCEFGCTPIVITKIDQRIDLTDRARGVSFDLDDDGNLEGISWIAEGSDEVLLALDRNGDGLITSGSELFGGATPQPSTEEPNGYNALAWYDEPSQGGNGDNRISAEDAVYESLLVWSDANHDGISQPGELASLSDAAILALELDRVISRKQDRHGNVLRWRSKVEFQDGVRPAAADVVLLHAGSTRRSRVR